MFDSSTNEKDDSWWINKMQHEVNLDNSSLFKKKPGIIHRSQLQWISMAWVVAVDIWI
jgi:hypothetical protein